MPLSLPRRRLLQALAAALPGCRGSSAGPAPAAPPDAGTPSPASAAALPVTHPAAFDPRDPAFASDPESFTPKRPPRPGDWLARFHETGTSFDEYIKSDPVGRTPQRGTLVVQPLGPFPDAERAMLETLRTFMSVFFDCPVVLAPERPLPRKGQRTHTEDGRTWTQHHTQVLLHEVLAPALPADAIALLGITMSDLYPEPSWNFVFGEATFDERVGVYSLARYFPAFTGEADTADARRLGLLRSFKVMAHETGHMFSLHHCVRYECLMNGTNSLDETDRSPGYECAECLRKLAWNLRFDVRARYRKLMEIYTREGLSDLARWVEARLRKIEAR